MAENKEFVKRAIRKAVQKMLRDKRSVGRRIVQEHSTNPAVRTSHWRM